MKEVTGAEEPEFFISDIDVDDEALEYRRPSNKRGRRKPKPVPRDFTWLRRTALGVLSFMALVVLISGSWIVYQHHAQWCPIREVRIEGTFVYLERGQFAKQIESVATGGFFAVNLDGIKEAAAVLPWVDSIMIRRVWPDTLVIQVAEKRALARWKEDALISDRGEIFQPSADSFPPGLVQLNGPDGSAMRVFKTLQRFETNAKNLAVKLNRITLDSRGSWQVGLTDGLSVVLGKESVHKRFVKFVRMYERIKETRQAAVDYVDMRYQNGFAVAFHPTDKRVSLQGN